MTFFLKKNKITLGLFLIVITLGGFLRLWKLGNPSFSADEFLGINASYGYFKTGQWKMWDFNQGNLTEKVYNRASLYYWQVAQIFRFFEPTEFYARLVSVFWGLLNLIGVFLFTLRKTKNKKLTLLAIFLLAISIAAINYDRKLRMYSMFSPLYFLLSWFVFNFIESKFYFSKLFSKELLKKVIFLGIIFFLGLISLHIHLLTVNILPSLIIYLILIIFLCQKNFLKKKEIIFGSWKFDQAKFFLAILFLFLLIFSFSTYVRDALLFFGWKEGNWSYLEKVFWDYSYLPLGLAFFILGNYYLIKNYKKIGIWVVVSFWVPLFLAIFVWNRSAGHQYIFFLHPFKVIIMAAGILSFSDTISRKIFLQKQKMAWRIILIVTLLILINFSFYFSKEVYWGNPAKWEKPNYRQVFKYILKRKESNDLIITRGFRNYYLAESNSKLFDFGGENKKGDRLTLEKIIKIQEDNQKIWLVISTSDWDHIEGKAKKYIQKTFQKIETNYTGSSMEIWFWKKEFEKR